jgi:GMP synthase (glutamine-hydrolysing)
MQKNKNKILFVNILSSDKKKKKEIERLVYNGKTYGEYFRAYFKIEKRDFREIYAVEEKLPDPKDFRMIIIGGSLVDPTKKKEKPWIEKTFSFIRRTKKESIPILGFCGGLQFAVRALGGTVVRNPKGRDMGTGQIVLSHAGKKDFLFKGLGKSIYAQESHKCMVEKINPEWVLLGSSKKTRGEAIAIGENIRLVQFHPELKRAHIIRLARFRKEALIEEGFVQEKNFKNFLSSIKDTEKTGKKIVNNFLSEFSARDTEK